MRSGKVLNPPPHHLGTVRVVQSCLKLQFCYYGLQLSREKRWTLPNTQTQISLKLFLHVKPTKTSNLFLLTVPSQYLSVFASESLPSSTYLKQTEACLLRFEAVSRANLTVLEIMHCGHNSTDYGETRLNQGGTPKCPY